MTGVSRLSPAFGGAVDNARLLAQANYGLCGVHKSKFLMYFIMLDGIVQATGMIQVKENNNLKCLRLAVEDCPTGHCRAWADYVCRHDSLQWSG